MVARLLLAAAALAAAIWLGLSYRSERHEVRALGVALTPARVGRAELDRALRDARAAQAYRPDAGPRLVEWRLLYRSGRRREAVGVLEREVRSEPENAEAWYFLSQVARDDSTRRESRRRLRALRPG